MNNKFYTFQTIDAQEMEMLLIELKKIINDRALENLLASLSYDENEDVLIIDGGSY